MIISGLNNRVGRSLNKFCVQPEQLRKITNQFLPPILKKFFPTDVKEKVLNTSDSMTIEKNKCFFTVLQTFRLFNVGCK
jgi:hypothetical protein